MKQVLISAGATGEHHEHGPENGGSGGKRQRGKRNRNRNKNNNSWENSNNHNGNGVAGNEQSKDSNTNSVASKAQPVTGEGNNTGSVIPNIPGGIDLSAILESVKRKREESEGPGENHTDNTNLASSSSLLASTLASLVSNNFPSLSSSSLAPTINNAAGAVGTIATTAGPVTANTVTAATTGSAITSVGNNGSSDGEPAAKRGRIE